jgi:gliding motility-associated-like protein
VIFSNLTWHAAADAFISPENICLDDSVFFSLEDTACHNYNPLIQHWTWFFGDGDSISNLFEGYHHYKSAGEYELKMVAEFQGGCKEPVTKFIHVQAPFVIDLGQDTLLAPHSSITLTAGPDQAGWNYTWSTGSLLNEVTLTDLTSDTVIWAYVTRDLCSAYDEIRVSIQDEPPPLKTRIDVPNAFSPDGDGRNDIFKPVFQEESPEEYKLSVFNRWGQQIFESNDPELGWDGTLNGDACPGEVYVYLIKYLTIDDNSSDVTLVKKGTLLLLR